MIISHGHSINTMQRPHPYKSQASRRDLRNHHHDTWRQACQLLRNAAEQQAGQTTAAASSDHEEVSFFAADNVDNRFAGIAPSVSQFWRRNAHADRALLRLLENFVNCRLHGLAEI